MGDVMQERMLPDGGRDVEWHKDELYAVPLEKIEWVSVEDLGGGEAGRTVELGFMPGGAVALRNLLEPEKEPLRYTASEWEAFRLGVLAGEFDDLGAGATEGD